MATLKALVVDDASFVRDLILCDWEMPEMSGLELLQWMRQQPQYEKIPFIMITSRGDKDHVIEAVKEGVSEYLGKPFSPEGPKPAVTKGSMSLASIRFADSTLKSVVKDINLTEVRVIAKRDQVFPGRQTLSSIHHPGGITLRGLQPAVPPGNDRQIRCLHQGGCAPPDCHRG